MPAMRTLQHAVIAAFVLALLGGMFLPVYSDEITWRFQERAGFDGVDKMLSDICGPTSLAVPPLFMMPVRHFSALFNSLFADPFYVRLSGVGYALILAGLVFTMIKRVASSANERVLLNCIAFGLLGFGMMPLLLVWSRPEQPLLIVLTAAIIVALGKRDPAEVATPKQAWLRSIMVLLLGCIALSYHLKGVALAPAFLICLLFCGSGRQTLVPRAIAAALLVLATALAAQYWVQRFQCPGDPVLAGKLAMQNLAGAALSGGDWRSTAAQLGQNANFSIYANMAAPLINPLSNWVPAGQLTAAEMMAWRTAAGVLWTAALYLGLVCLILAARSRIRERRLDAGFALAAILLGVLIVWAISQTNKNIYDATFVLFLCALLTVIALASLRLDEVWLKRLRWLAAPLALAAIASPLRIAAIFGPSFRDAAAQSGYIAQQQFSMPVTGYSALEPQILSAAKLCGIDPTKRPRNLLIDDVTYFAFMRSYRPQHQLGVITVWNGSITDPVAYLKSVRSDGAVLGCHNLPPEMRRRAKQSGKFCCLGPPGW